MAFGRSRKKKQDDSTDSTDRRVSTEAAQTPSDTTGTGPAEGKTGGADPTPDAGSTTDAGPTTDAGSTEDAGPTPDTVTDAMTDEVTAAASAPPAHVSSAEYDRATLGPFDASEQDTESGYIDLGALRINAAEGLQLRLEVEERSKRVIAVTLDLGGSTLQLQAFAAPKTEGLWDEIRGQIGASVGSQGGTVEERPGVLGTELLAKVPAQTPDGQAGVRLARFVGVNGPRWFLRGVLGGPAALQREAAAPVEQLFRSVVVVRGDQPLPPRELLQLRLPTSAAEAPPAAGPAPARNLPNPLERGPEITETR